MLHPKYNRIDYGEQLIPPIGYELAYAVGTSYSLDLEALMILPVALFYAQKLDGNPEELRYDMLDAITKAADKIILFYQNGQLKVPKKYHHLMAYWENGIQPVTMPNHVSSFHPKVWIIRYESKDAPPIYRVLVTSRNLTFARDWDMAFTTDGVVTEKEQIKNRPLIHFLQYLNSTGKKEISTSFIADLQMAKFELPDKFDSLKFVPIGISNPETKKLYANPITTAKIVWDEMLIMSPFLDESTLNTIKVATNKKAYLLSRKEELDAVDVETLRDFDCWQFSTFFQEAEYFQELEDDGSVPLSQNLHAKFFVSMLDKIPYWYLGSANCSDPAQSRNVEFMVELKGGNWSGLKTKDMFKQFTNPEKADGISLFTEYNSDNRVSVEEQKGIDLAIRKIKFDLTQLPIKGTATLLDGGSAYNLAIEIDATKLIMPKGFEVKIKPLPEQQKATVLINAGTVNVINNFSGYAETALSIFLIFEILKGGTVYSQFLLPMAIELPNSRLNKIFTSIIDSREKFLKYLTFLLAGEETATIGDVKGNKNKAVTNEGDAWAFTGTPVYEKLLVATSRYPERLKSIDALIQRLKDESSDLKEPIITAEFESFWNVFQTFIKNKN